jgi:hypothetical protein
MVNWMVVNVRLSIVAAAAVQINMPAFWPRGNMAVFFVHGSKTGIGSKPINAKPEKNASWRGACPLFEPRPFSHTYLRNISGS